VEGHHAECVPDRVVQLAGHVRVLFGHGPVRCLFSDARSQLFLGPLALGDVEQRTVEQRPRSVGPPDATPTLQDPDRHPIRSDHPVLTGEIVLLGELCGDLSRHSVSVIWMDHARERAVAVPDEPLGGETGDDDDLVADELHSPLDVVGAAVDHARQGPEQLTDRIRVHL
jgi:hypothetical protein